MGEWVVEEELTGVWKQNPSLKLFDIYNVFTCHASK
jgi:hypothetical protein